MSKTETQQRQTRQAFAKRGEIASRLEVSPALLDAVQDRFPVRWPRYYLDLVDGPEHPIARMGRPDPRELSVDPGDLFDPVSDMALRPVPFVVRKHRDRVIVLTTKKCHFYCRFCFRRDESFASVGEPNAADWARIYAFLRQNPEIEEPILSGGDPLTLSDAALFHIKEVLNEIPSLKRWRIHTRAPVHFPERVTPALVKGLSGGLPLRVVTHYNHASEITAETRRIADLFQAADIELLNQAVLLAGVNDSPTAQLELWQGLVQHGIKPYYLHHPDRAAGNASFRLSIAEGRGIYARLCQGLGQPPKYVLDLPDGRGKVPVMALQKESASRYSYLHDDGTCSHYDEGTADK